jgi:hypothetical protein
MTKVGEISQQVIDLLGLGVAAGTPIYLGQSNHEHMATQHPRIFKKYGARLERILASPDYVGSRSDGTIEYIKAFGQHIKVAVRITGDGEYYARTLYDVNDKKVKKMVAIGEWKALV